jgi:hypothetical protein
VNVPSPKEITGPKSSNLEFQRIFDNPVFGHHSPLVLGWSDDQLRPVVERLDPVLPAGLTDKWKLAIAACASAVVAEAKLTGGGVHYARRREAYRIPKRYRCGDPRFTYHFVTGAMDHLRHARLITEARGYWSRVEGRGRQSVAWATDELMSLVGPLVDPRAQRGLPTQVETVVLRDRRDKRDIDYEETAETSALRAEVETINNALAGLRLLLHGKECDIPLGRRVFNGSFDRGGRFYCHGSSFQNMPKQERRALKLVIDGVTHSMVEIDYSNLHIAMAYTEAGELMPPGDQYAIEGFDRGLVKLAVNTVFNARTRRSGVLAIAEKLYTERSLRTASGLAYVSLSVCLDLAERVVAAIEHKHHRIKDYFNSDCGAGFQRLDSDMAMAVMLAVIQRTGRCPLPMHDSFLVADIDADVLASTMSEVATNHGLQLTLKDSDGHQWSTTPFHMGVKNTRPSGAHPCRPGIRLC